MSTSVSSEISVRSTEKVMILQSDIPFSRTGHKGVRGPVQESYRRSPTRAEDISPKDLALGYIAFKAVKDAGCNPKPVLREMAKRWDKSVRTVYNWYYYIGQYFEKSDLSYKAAPCLKGVAELVREFTAKRIQEITVVSRNHIK